MTKACLDEKFALIHEHWRPKVVAQLNGLELKLVKFAGVFPWHRHEHEDEMFLVWRGQITTALPSLAERDDGIVEISTLKMARRHGESGGSGGAVIRKYFSTQRPDRGIET